MESRGRWPCTSVLCPDNPLQAGASNRWRGDGPRLPAPAVRLTTSTRTGMRSIVAQHQIGTQGAALTNRCRLRDAGGMAAGTEQMKWAVLLRARESSPGTLDFDDASRWGDVRIDQALGAFSRDVSTGSDEERVTAAGALGWMLDGRAASPLIRALRDPVDDVRRAAARAFASYISAPDWAVDALVRACSDQDASVRRDAAQALRRYRHIPLAAQALCRGTRDPVASVRAAAEASLRG